MDQVNEPPKQQFNGKAISLEKPVIYKIVHTKLYFYSRKGDITVDRIREVLCNIYRVPRYQVRGVMHELYMMGILEMNANKYAKVTTPKYDFQL